GISWTRPSTRAAMSNRVASTSPCTSRGSPRTRYQIDRMATAAATTPTMMAGAKGGVAACFFGATGGGCGAGGVAPLCAGGASVRASVAVVSIRIPASGLRSDHHAVPVRLRSPLLDIDKGAAPQVVPRDKQKATDQPEMLEKGIGGHEPFLAWGQLP